MKFEKKEASTGYMNHFDDNGEDFCATGEHFGSVVNEEVNNESHNQMQVFIKGKMKKNAHSFEKLNFKNVYGWITAKFLYNFLFENVRLLLFEKFDFIIFTVCI